MPFAEPWSALIDAAHDAVIVRTADGRIVYWNSGAERLYGVPRAEAEGRLSDDLLHSEYKRPRAEVERQLAAQGYWEGQIAQTRADGVRLHVASRWVRQETANGPLVLEINRDETARLHAESELIARNRQFRLIADHAPVMIAHCDAAARYYFVNRPYAERFGLTPSEVIGLHLSDLVGSAAYDMLRPYLAQVLAGNRVEFQLELPYRGIGRHVVHCVYAPERDVTGATVGFLAAVLDVTSHKDAEEALRASAERLDFVARSAEIGIWSCDLPFDRLVWNAKCKAHFGLPADADVTIDAFYERLHPDDIAPTQRAIEASIAGHAVLDCEYRTQQPGGDYAWIRAIGRAAYTPDGQPVRFDGITIDITAQKRAEALLREREAYFREMVDNAPVLLWVTDASGTCTYLSKQWYEYTGGSPSAHLGFGWSREVHREDAERMEEVFLDATARHVPFAVDYRLHHRDGTFRWVVDAGLPRVDANGTFQGFVGTVVDIHDRKMAEQALADADRRKDEFLATLAHELRNPLAPLVTALRLLEVAEHDLALAARARGIMRRQLAQLTKLVDDLLDVSRITRGKFQLRPERLTVEAVVHSAVEASASLIHEKSHEFSVALPPEPLHVVGDPTRLAQVLLNLLNNAAKYTPAGGRITVTAFRDGDRVALQVTDTGIGIASDALPSIFDIFVQDEQARELATGGLGIGLTLVKRLVELHGGEVEARSDGRGRGATFTVYLPAAGAGLDTTPSEAVPQAMPTMRRRVLIADDNRDARESLELLLRQQGHDVRLAVDGVEALELGASFEPEVVFLDIGMPRMNGYDAARRMREQPWGRRALLVAMTGWGQPEDRARSRAAGIDHHLSKPVDPSVIEQYLQTSTSSP